MMFLNYPNNPTAATVDKKFLKEAVDFAKDNKHDAYAMIMLTQKSLTMVTVLQAF